MQVSRYWFYLRLLCSAATRERLPSCYPMLNEIPRSLPGACTTVGASRITSIVVPYSEYVCRIMYLNIPQNDNGTCVGLSTTFEGDFSPHLDFMATSSSGRNVCRYFVFRFFLFFQLQYLLRRGERCMFSRNFFWRQLPQLRLEW